MPTLDQMKALRGTPGKPTTTTDAFKAQVVAALAAADLEVTSEGAAAGPHSVLVLCRDEDEDARIWVIPDANIDAEDRARLASIHGAYFQLMFSSELRPAQFAGALVLLLRTGELKVSGPEDGLFLDITEGFADDDVEVPELDFATIKGNVWGGREVTDGELGAIELTHFYCAQLGM